MSKLKIKKTVDKKLAPKICQLPHLHMRGVVNFIKEIILKLISENLKIVPKNYIRTGGLGGGGESQSQFYFRNCLKN